MARALVWYRDDLRLDDHLALDAALAHDPDGAALVAVLDPRVWGPARLSGIALPRLGLARARFWMESVAALRTQVRAKGGELLVRSGAPEEILPRLARSLGATEVFAQAHVADEETRQEEAVRASLAAVGVRLALRPGRTLVHPEDLPFPVGRLPGGFTAFRKKVEARSPFRDPIDPPARLPPGPDLDPGSIPDPDRLGVDLGPAPPGPALLSFHGGEGAGRARLRQWIWEADALGAYKSRRNGLLEADDSSKLSPWLAHGCLSPRRVHAEVRAYEAERGASEETYWLVFELLWRDYFAFLALREGPRLFARSGVGRRPRPFTSDRERFDAWREGRTGIPFVDAFMRELRATGFMSNRGRQNVASYLAKTLGVDWRWGAAWFEACLVDYDPASNWGNWQYAAGVGTDPRDRVFNVVKQAFDYDVNADYVRRWVPEVRHLPGGRAQVPWEAGGVPGYPPPLALPTPPPRATRGGGRSRRSPSRRG